MLRPKMWRWPGTGQAAIASTDGPGAATIARPRLLLICTLWIIGIGFALWIVEFRLLRDLEKRDFAIFWIAGKAALGAPSMVYDPAAIAPQWLSALKPDHGSLAYPPHFLLLIVPFSLLPLLPAFLLWNALSAALFMWAAKPYMRGLPSILAFLTPAASLNFLFGQTGLLVGALWLFAFRKHGWAVGLLSLKPHIGFLAILTLDRRRFVIAALTGVAALGLALILFPSAVLGFASAFMQHASHLQTGYKGIWYFVVVTPLQGYGIAGWVIFGGAAILLLRRRFDVFTAATATFLISPYGLHYDMTVACLGMGLAMLDERRPWAMAALTFGFLAPCMVILGTWFAPPFILAALYAQVTAKDAELASSPAEPDAAVAQSV